MNTLGRLKWSLAVMLALLNAACQGDDSAQVESTPDTGGRKIVTEFRAQADPASGLLAFETLPDNATDSAPSMLRQGLTAINNVQDGVSGSGPPNSVELVTESTGEGATACARANSFCGQVRLRSFFTTLDLRGCHIELTQMAPVTGNTAFGDSPANQGLSSILGLWSYGTIGTNGGNSLRTWKFDNFSGSAFTFRGRVMCSPEPPTDPIEGNCANSLDDDGDGATDCDDPDCSIDTSCATEACGNGYDDDGDGDTDCDDPDCITDVACPETTSDVSAPTVGTAITFTDVMGTALTVRWGSASDNVTLPADLQYKLVKATSEAAIDTVNEADAIGGADLLMNWTAATVTRKVTALKPSTTYWFAVLVRDEADNKALYTPTAQTTIYTNWNPGSPNNGPLHSEWCGFLSRNWGGTWDDRACGIYGKCVCRRANGSLFLTSSNATWSQCPAACTSAGGTFSMPKNASENATVFGLTTIEYNWISYYDPTHSTSTDIYRLFVEWVP